MSYGIDKVTMDEGDYSVRYATQLYNKNGFKEQVHGARKKLYVYNRCVASTSQKSYLDLGGLDAKQFSSFLGLFSKKLYAQHLENPELFSINIGFKGVSRGKSMEVWSKMPIGTFFYNIDLNSAYWQMLFRLGYIDETMYYKYIDQPEYKTAKRFCVSFLARPNKMVYHKTSGEKIEISCDTEVLRNVYRNVRNELYNTVKNALGDGSYLEYNIDGVTVPANIVENIKKYFHNEGLRFKTTFCRKISENEYLYGSKTKVFKKK